MLKVREIPAAVFAAQRDWSALGFVRVEGYSTLYSHANWPGMLFKRVANVHQAMAFGGVLVGDNTHELLFASKQSASVSDWSCGVVLSGAQVSPNKTPFFVRDDKMAWFGAEFSVCTHEIVDIVPTYGMAVVSNCSALGFRAKSAPVKIDYFRGPLVSPKGLSASVINDEGVTGSSLVPLQQYLVQWLEIPFAQDGGAFIRAAVPAIADTYPSEVKSGMTTLLTNISDDATANPSGPSTFVLTRVTTSADSDAMWGGLVTGTYTDPLLYECYRRLDVAPIGTAPTTYRIAKEGVQGGFFDDALKCLRVPGRLVVDGGFRTQDMPAHLTVAANLTLDMSKVLPEFGPLAKPVALTGTKAYSELVTGSALSSDRLDNDYAAMAERPRRNQLRSPLGLRSVEVDLLNLMIRAEAAAMDERVYAASTGTAFGDASGSLAAPALDSQSTGYVYTAAMAQLRGDGSSRAIGSIVYEDAGIFTAPKSGRYSITCVGNGTRLLDNASMHGKSNTSSVELAEGVAYEIAFSNAFGVGNNQMASLIYLIGPNITRNEVCLDYGSSPQEYRASSVAPVTGVIGSNGVALGRRQETAGGPYGKAAVIIKLETVDG